MSGRMEKPQHGWMRVAGPSFRICGSDWRLAPKGFRRSFAGKTSHCQNDTELRLAAKHALVCLGGFFERTGFNHGTHAGELGKAQRVLGIRWCSRCPTLNRSTSHDELNRCDIDGLG